VEADSQAQAVMRLMAAGNRDPERFLIPTGLDITRTETGILPSVGGALLLCAALARIEGQVAFELMLRRLPYLALEPGRSHGAIIWDCGAGSRSGSHSERETSKALHVPIYGHAPKIIPQQR